jgi:hypothetical protein
MVAKKLRAVGDIEEDIPVLSDCVVYTKATHQYALAAKCDYHKSIYAQHHL